MRISVIPDKLPSNDTKANNEMEQTDIAKTNTTKFTYEEVSINLKVIGQVKEDEKLYIYNDTLHIDNRYFQTIRRLISGDGRDSTIDFICELLKSANLYFLTLLDSLRMNLDPKPINHDLNNLKTDLNFCLYGLEKLKITYRDDHVFRSTIDGMIDKIRVITENNMNRQTNNYNAKL